MTDIAKLKGAIRFMSQWSKGGDVQRWHSPVTGKQAYCLNGDWVASDLPSLRVLASLIDGRRTLGERHTIMRALRSVRKLEAMGLAA